MWGWLYNILKVTLAVSSTVKEFDQNSAVKTTFINKLAGITRSHKKQVMIFLNLFFFLLRVNAVTKVMHTMKPVFLGQMLRAE